MAPCSGGCSGPLENLDWILQQDPHSIHRERSVFRRKKTIFQIISLTVQYLTISSFERSRIKRGCGEGSLTWVTPGWVLVVLVCRYGKVQVNVINRCNIQGERICDHYTQFRLITCYLSDSGIHCFIDCNNHLFSHTDISHKLHQSKANIAEIVYCFGDAPVCGLYDYALLSLAAVQHKGSQKKLNILTRTSQLDMDYNLF